MHSEDGVGGSCQVEFLPGVRNIVRPEQAEALHSLARQLIETT